jgi:hypothetical protein
VPYLVLNSVEFTGASHPAEALLSEVMRQHSGSATVTSSFRIAG